MTGTTPHPPGRRPTRSGFTIVELLIVMILIGLVVALTIPSFRQIQMGSSLRAARQEIARTFVTARQTAIMRGRPTRVILSQGRVGAQLQNAAGNWVVLLPAKNLDSLYDVDLAAPTAGDSLVQFDSRGLVSPVGTRRITVAHGARTDTLCLAGSGTLKTKTGACQ